MPKDEPILPQPVSAQLPESRQKPKTAPLSLAKAKADITPVNCESYREAVYKYFGDYTDQALFVFGKESRGCTVNISDAPNPNGTYDYCIAQINNEPSVRYDIDKCVRRAWEKFKPYKHWSQWYSVCSVKRVPKYPNINCN